MIQIRQLSAGYSGVPVVQEATLDFLPGQVLVLLGPNGCGKSTLLKAALGLLPPMGGQVLYDGVEITQLSRKEVSRKTAFLTQSRNTPSIQALRMVLHGRFPYLSYPRRYGKQDYAISQLALETTGSLRHENANVSTLSGGQR